MAGCVGSVFGAGCCHLGCCLSGGLGLEGEAAYLGWVRELGMGEFMEGDSEFVYEFDLDGAAETGKACESLLAVIRRHIPGAEVYPKPIGFDAGWAALWHNGIVFDDLPEVDTDIMRGALRAVLADRDRDLADILE